MCVLSETEGAVHCLDFFRKTLLDTLLTRESLRAEMDGTDHVNGAVSYSSLGDAVGTSA